MSGRSVDQLPFGTSRVLIADDDDLLREVITMALERCGGRVLAAKDGLDAVAVFTAHQNEIDYAFLDFSMPGLNGYEVYLEIKKRKPSVHVVFISGLETNPEVTTLAAGNEVEFVCKPFRSAELIAAAKRLNARVTNA